MSTIEQLFAKFADAARRGGCSELDIATLRQLLLERHSLPTIETARLVALMEKSMTAMTAGERRDAICARMDISRRWYYKLKKLSSAPAECTIEA